MYQVVCKFTDLLDSNHLYSEGEVYPRNGYTPSPDRIEELSTNRNKAHMPLIVFIPDPVVEESEPVVQAVVQEPESVVEEPVKVVEKQTTRGRKKKNVDNAD